MNETITLSTRAADELVASVTSHTLVISRETLLEMARELLRANRKIYAIKLVRMATGHGLLISKTIVDIEEAKMLIPPRIEF